MRTSWLFACGLALVLNGLVPCVTFAETKPTETVEIDVKAKGKPFPHFWEHMFGSGRASLSLRESYRHDLKKLKEVCDAQYLRFHGIFHDELGVYDEDAAGNPVYNWTYIDQIYDGLRNQGIRPFVELSFMPNKLAASSMPHSFWYKPNTSPPKSDEKWYEFIRQFALHLKERYGADEVSRWYFEVWNEPNIDFWGGSPKEETYYKLYDGAARALKSVDSRFQVGGPATAQAAWVDKFIAHCVHNNIPLDFVSTHVYGNDSAKDVFGTNETIGRGQMVARAVRKVHDQVKESARPNLPIFFSEYNASYMNEVNITDSAFMGPWLANNIAQCDGLVNEMALWTFSDVFEEQGVAKKPFYGGFGLIATGGIPKASYNAMMMLHKLGSERLPVDCPSCIVTRKADGSLVVAAWNYVEPGRTASPGSKTFNINLRNTKFKTAKVTVLDHMTGSPLTVWRSMKAPAFPTREQQRKLINSAKLPPAKIIEMGSPHPSLSVQIYSNALALIEFPIK